MDTLKIHRLSTNLFRLFFKAYLPVHFRGIWQARRDSNPQHADLESAALPLELLAYVKHLPEVREVYLKSFTVKCYSTISDTTPEPTLRPPSRIANLIPLSIATGEISSTSISTLSPGITISTVSGNTIEPVISVVLK